MILDINMPKMDGLAMFKAMRTAAPAPGTPVVFLTERAKLDVAKLCFDMGAVEFVPKPVRFDDLLRVVKEALGEFKAKVRRAD